jgi:hypothetical protein
LTLIRANWKQLKLKLTYVAITIAAVPLQTEDAASSLSCWGEIHPPLMSSSTSPSMNALKSMLSPQSFYDCFYAIIIFSYRLQCDCFSRGSWGRSRTWYRRRLWSFGATECPPTPPTFQYLARLATHVFALLNRASKCHCT